MEQFSAIRGNKKITSSCEQFLLIGEIANSFEKVEERARAFKDAEPIILRAGVGTAETSRDFAPLGGILHAPLAG